MNRLTCKPDNKVMKNYYYETTEKTIIEDKITILNKLGQLEDIEEELGIDLTLRHKIETSDKLYCRNHKGEIVETRYYYSYGKDGVGLELPMEIEPYWCVSSYPWKDYGKTWALTKEELE